MTEKMIVKLKKNCMRYDQPAINKTRTIAVSDSYPPTIVHYKGESRVRCVVEIAKLGKTFSYV